MNRSVSRRGIRAALTTVGAAALLVGSFAQTASATTFFRTVDSKQAGRQLTITSSQDNSPVKFGPRFNGTSACASCGFTDVPPEMAFAQVKIAPNIAGVSLVNKKTGKCLDVEPSAQKSGAQVNGANVVLAECDATQSQQWKVTVSFGSQTMFVNKLPTAEQMALTDSLGKAILEPITVNNNLPPAERLKHVQIFSSRLVSVE
ncbi:RICIN domain-containing protein [Kribbella sp. CA-253562]|uniref:RICIN domain-containing protein n=1 Tax=Kribbella sp. CA-253562 TaxID=3239942 RepID=UPI003D8DC4A0